MKKMQSTTILFFFLLLFLLRGTIEEYFIYFEKMPTSEEALEITIQNLEENLKKLEEQNNISSNPKDNYVFTKILFRDPFSFFETATMLKGEKDGLKENMAILQGKNLVGVIESLNDHSSKIRLLTNKDTNISIKIKDAYGTLSTNSKKECWIEDLTKRVNLEIGDTITTSGLTSIPANILIGSVEEIIKDELGLIQKVKVTLYADLNELNYVTVMSRGDQS